MIKKSKKSKKNSKKGLTKQKKGGILTKLSAMRATKTQGGGEMNIEN